MDMEAARLQLRRETVIRQLIACGRSMAALRRTPDGKLRRLFWRLFQQKRREAAYHRLGRQVRPLREELLEIEQQQRKYGGPV